MSGRESKWKNNEIDEGNKEWRRSGYYKIKGEG